MLWWRISALASMDRLGLCYETLREINPKLVYASIRGFGDPRTADSPYMEWPAFDVVAQAMGGIMGITGPDRETPTKIGPGVGDLTPALFCVIGVLSAVMRARETGQGQYVDVAMVDSILSICERMVHQYSFEGKLAAPEGNHHPFLAPFGMFPAKDGWVSIGCPNDAFWETLARKLGLDALLEDERFRDPMARAEHRRDVIAAVSEATQKHTKAELADLLGGSIPFGPVYNMADIAADPHFAARDMVVAVDTPGLDAPTKIAGTPIRMTETPGGVHQRAPFLGEHTEAVLKGRRICDQPDRRVARRRRHQVTGIERKDHDPTSHAPPPQPTCGSGQQRKNDEESGGKRRRPCVFRP